MAGSGFPTNVPDDIVQADAQQQFQNHINSLQPPSQRVTPPDQMPQAGDVAGWRQVIQAQTAQQDKALADDPDFINSVLAGGYAESGLNPTRRQQGGNGVGFFQFDTGGGMGTGLSDQQLNSEEYQASHILPEYIAAYKSAPSNLSGADKAAWVAAHAERPLNYDDPSSQANQNYRAAYAAVTGNQNAPQAAQGAQNGVLPSAGVSAQASGKVTSPASFSDFLANLPKPSDVVRSALNPVGSAANLGATDFKSFAASLPSPSQRLQATLGQSFAPADQTTDAASADNATASGTPINPFRPQPPAPSDQGVDATAGSAIDQSTDQLQPNPDLATAVTQGLQNIGGVVGGAVDQTAQGVAGSPAGQLVGQGISDVTQFLGDATKQQPGMPAPQTNAQVNNSNLGPGGQALGSLGNTIGQAAQDATAPHPELPPPQTNAQVNNSDFSQQAQLASEGAQAVDQNVASPLAGTLYAGIEGTGQQLTGQPTRPFEQNLPTDPLQAWLELGRRWAANLDTSQLPENQQGSASLLHSAADFFNPVFWSGPGILSDLGRTVLKMPEVAEKAPAIAEAVAHAGNAVMGAGYVASATPQMPGESDEAYQRRVSVGNVAQVAGLPIALGAPLIAGAARRVGSAVGSVARDVTTPMTDAEKALLVTEGGGYDPRAGGAAPTPAQVVSPSGRITPSPGEAPVVRDVQGQPMPLAEAQVSWETAPGDTTPGYAAYQAAPPAQKLAYHAAVRRALIDDNGRDILADALGLTGGDTFDAPGVYRGEVTPGAQTQMRVSPPKLLDAYASALGLLLKQNSVGWSRPIATDVLSKANAKLIDIGRVLTDGEAAKLDQAITAARGPDSHAIVSSPTGAYVLNIGGDNAVFQKALTNVVEGLQFDGVKSATLHSFAADTRLIENDWRNSPNGEDYLRSLRDAGGAGLEDRVLPALAERISQAQKEFGDFFQPASGGSLTDERAANAATRATDEAPGARGGRSTLPDSGGVDRYYHGTAGGFTSPNPTQFQSTEFGKVYWLTQNPDDARTYALINSHERGGAPTGMNIRAVNVPQNLKLLDITKHPDILAQFRAATENGFGYGDRPELAATREAIRLQLAQLGYDGINDGMGHIAVFPESLPKITNAISGLTLGSAPQIGGAFIGGYAGYNADPNASPQDRLRNTALGAVAGGLVGHGVARSHFFQDALPEVSRGESVQTRAARLRPDGTPIGNAEVAAGAERYVRENGIANGIPDSTYLKNDPELQQRVAQAYDRAPHEPNNPAVQHAYREFAHEVSAQYEYATRPVADGGMGITFEPWNKEGQPYASSAEMRADVAQNHHLYFFQGGDLPADHPVARIDPKTGLSINDEFRAVHDLFGHSAQGFDFGPRGELNAFREHSKMFSADAQQAMATETNGQNSWVNYGPHGDANRANPTNTIYADQKATVLPNWARDPGVPRGKPMGASTSTAERNLAAINAGLDGNGGGQSLVDRSSNPETQKLLDMFGHVPEEKSAGVPALERWRRTAVRLWTDQRVDLAQIQAQAAKSAGRSLGPDEMAYELSRLNPDMQAQVNIQHNLTPAIRSVGKDRALLSAYLVHMDNIDVAAAMGNQAARDVLEQEIKVPAQKDVRVLQSRIRMYQRLRDEGAAAGDGTVVTHYDQLISQSQTQLKGASTRQVKQENIATSERAAKARTVQAQVANDRKFSGELTRNDSVQAVRDLQAELGPDRFQKVQDAAEQVWQFNRDLLQQKVDAGLIPQQVANELQHSYPHYVKTEVTDFLTDPNSISKGRSLSVNDAGIRRNSVEGTIRDREDPLVSSLRNAYETQALVNRNYVFGAVAKLRTLDPAVGKIIRPVGDDFKETRGEIPLSGFVNGTKEKFAVPRDLEYLVRGAATAPIPGLSTAMAITRAVMASRNPLFIPMHFKITVMPYLIREMTRAGGPQNLPKVAGALIPSYIDAFNGILHGEYHGDTARYLAGGGGIFGGFEPSLQGGRKTLEEVSRSPLTIRNAGDLARVTRDLVLGKPIEEIINRVDLAPRVAAMKLAEGRGENPIKAVMNGRTSTIDFAQGGTIPKFLNQFIPFFNVGVQAGAQPIRAIRDNPAAFLATAVATLAAPTLAVEAWNRSDPQRSQDYDDVPQYIKDRGLVLMLPGDAPLDAQGNRHPQFIPIETREFSPFVMTTREIANRVLGSDPRDWADLIGHGLMSQLPIQGDNASNALGMFNPVGVKTGLELAVDKDFYRNRPIASKRGDQNASPLDQTIASATGLRPSQASYAVNDLGGGIGALAESASRLGQPSQGDETPQRTPILGQMVGRFVRGDIGNDLNVARGETLPPSARTILAQYGLDKDINPSPVGGTANNLPLTVQEEAQYQKLANRYVDQAIHDLAVDKDFQSWDHAVQLRAMQNVIDKARARAKGEVITSIPDAELDQRLSAAEANGARVPAAASRASAARTTLGRSGLPAAQTGRLPASLRKVP